MANYRDESLLQELGRRLKNQRLRKKLEIKDISERTGFSADTIKNIERGNETTISYFIQICKALNIHPKDIFDFPIKLISRNEASPARIEKTRLTNRIKDYVTGNYFSEYRGAADVKTKLENDYNIKTTSAAVSVILSRMVQTKDLIFKKTNRKKMYIKGK